MTSIRARLIACAVAILVCQGAALSAAPIAVCRGILSAAVDLDDCCRNLDPGQTCPMHHTTHRAGGQRGPAWTCVCSPSDAVLASLLGVAGALPGPIRASRVPIRASIVAAQTSATLARHEPPTSPPPRA